MASAGLAAVNPPSLWDKLKQTWPARMAQEGLAAIQLPGDVAANKFTQQPSTLGMWSDEDEAAQQAMDRQRIERTADLAGMLMGGSYNAAPAGSVGIFGGRLAKTADQAALSKAEELAANGAPREQIWNDTGWFQGADGKWRFEIDDSTSVAKAGTPGTVQQKLTHPELTAAYPDIADVRLRWGEAPGRGSHQMRSPSGSPENIGLSQADPMSKSKEILLHELQHAVQSREGFTSGASPSWFNQQDDAKLARDALSFRRELEMQPRGMDSSAKENAIVQQYQGLGAMDWLPPRAARDLAHDTNNNPSQQLEELVKLYGLDQRATPYSARENYKRMGGEVEARNVSDRAWMSAAERRAKAPWTTEDTPPGLQILRIP